MYQTLDMETEAEGMLARVESEFPGSPEAEQVAYGRMQKLYRELQDQERRNGNKDPELVVRHEAMVEAFLARPVHHNPERLGFLYATLFFQIAEAEKPDPEQLLRAVEGMIEHDKLNPHLAHARGAIELARKTQHKERALEIARAGFAAAEQRLREKQKYLTKPGQYEEARAYLLGDMHLAEGVTLAELGRLDEAEKTLLEAHEKNKGPKPCLELGRLAERRSKLGVAETYYVEGLGRPTLAQDNPCEDALEALYEKRRGSSKGFDRYLARLERKHRRARKREILASREDEPRPLPAFELKDLEGATFASTSLRGKVTAITFWSLWCGFCVRETEQLEELMRKYADDREVEILTIAGDGNRDDLKKWLAENGHDLPMLLDEGYAHRAGVDSWPTTWFVDREGRIAFVRNGGRAHLVEEASWRIKDLKRR
jgi:thiol-disulfide isomerase/thioredoxin